MGSEAPVDLAIDGGTTNTRVRALSQGQVIAHASRAVGVRDTAITGSTDKLVGALGSAIDEVREQVATAHADIRLVVASGMITSNVGLVEIPHVPAPAGVDELARAVCTHTFDALGGLTVRFVPGVKTLPPEPALENVHQIDMMRGEEVETIGIMQAEGIDGPVCLLLPGSHTKIVRVDPAGRIAASATTLAGEMIQALSQHTILAGSLPDRMPESLDTDWARHGADFARQHGFSRGLFAVRLLEHFVPSDPAQRASFLAGLVLRLDIEAAERSGLLDRGAIVVGGPPALRTVLCALLHQAGYGDRLRPVRDDTLELASARGAVHVVQHALAEGHIP